MTLTLLACISHLIFISLSVRVLLGMIALGLYITRDAQHEPKVTNTKARPNLALSKPDHDPITHKNTDFNLARRSAAASTIFQKYSTAKYINIMNNNWPSATLT